MNATKMTDHSDVNATKIALVGLFGGLVTIVFALFAIVLYLGMADRVRQSRSEEAAARIQRQVDKIHLGNPIAQPWLDADLQRATQEAALADYGARIIEEEDGNRQVKYSIPIGQAMEAVVQELSAESAKAGSDDKANDSQNAEVKS